MSLEDVREISDLFGEALVQSLEKLAKDAQVRGGGLRHGDVEWQVSYSYGGLHRVLTFSLHKPTPSLITISAQAFATDEKGRWAAAPAASTSLPDAIAHEQLMPLVSSLLDQARFVANDLDGSQVSDGRDRPSFAKKGLS